LTEILVKQKFCFISLSSELAASEVPVMIGRLGERIRDRRRHLKKTIQAVADATGLSIGLMSQIERHLTVPSFSSLATVAEFLDASIGDLTGQPAVPHPDTYHDKCVRYALGDGLVRYERLSSVFPGSALHPVKFTMPYGYGSETVSHHGEELAGISSSQPQESVALLPGRASMHDDSAGFRTGAGVTGHPF
jgi:transcriptional regulator with XRE-family HTH domain